MKAIVALCLLVAYLLGCAKIGDTHRGTDDDSERVLKSNTGVIVPPAPKDPPSRSRESDQANQETHTKLETSSSTERKDNNQFTHQRVREDRDHSTTKEEILARIAPRLSRSSAGLPVKYGSDGQMVIDLKGRFSHVSLAKRMPDGTVRSRCVDNIKSARAWLFAGERPAKER